MNPITLEELVDRLDKKRLQLEADTCRPATRCYVSKHIIRSVAHEITAACTRAMQTYSHDPSEPTLKIHGFPVFQVQEDNHIEVA